MNEQHKNEKEEITISLDSATILQVKFVASIMDKPIDYVIELMCDNCFLFMSLPPEEAVELLLKNKGVIPRDGELRMMVKEVPKQEVSDSAHYADFTKSVKWQ